MIGKISKGRSFSGLLNYLFKLKELGMPKRESEQARQERKDQELEWALNGLENVERDRAGPEQVERGRDEQTKEVEAVRRGDSDNDREPESRGKIISTNMAGRNPKELWREFDVQASLNPEVKRCVFHCSIGIPKEDNVSPEQKVQIVERFVREAGFENTMWLAVEHDEHDHKEIHFVASLIDFDGRTISDSKDYERVEEVMRSTEKGFGLREVAPSRAAMRRCPTQKELKYFERTGVLSTRVRLQAHIDEALGRGASTTELIERLEARSIQVIPYVESGEVHGISYRLDGKVMRGTDLGRGYTWQGLQKEWPNHREYRQGRMNYEPERDYEAVRRAGSRESEREDRGAGARAVEALVGRPNGGDRAELPEDAAGRNRVDDPAAGVGHDQLSEGAGRQTSERQPGGDGGPTRRAGDQDERTYRDAGAGEPEGGREAGRPAISERADAETHSNPETARLDLRGAGEEGGDHVEESGIGDTGGRRHAPEYLDEALEGDTAEPRRDNYTDDLPGYTPTRVGLPADVADDRGEQLLEAPYLRHEGGGESAPDSATQSQAAPLSRTAEQHQDVGGQPRELEQPSPSDSAGSTLDRLFRLIDEAQRPVHEREQQEAALLKDKAGADATRESAEQAAPQEQQTCAAESARELALRAANFRVDLRVWQMLEEDGREGLYFPESIDELRLTVEQTLGEYGVQLSGIGLTRDSLAEQLSSYVVEIGNDPETFLSRMEASDFDRPSGQEVSDIQDDALTRDDDEYEPSR